MLDAKWKPRGWGGWTPLAEFFGSLLVRLGAAEARQACHREVLGLPGLVLHGHAPEPRDLLWMDEIHFAPHHLRSLDFVHPQYLKNPYLFFKEMVLQCGQQYRGFAWIVSARHAMSRPTLSGFGHEVFFVCYAGLPTSVASCSSVSFLFILSLTSAPHSRTEAPVMDVAPVPEKQRHCGGLREAPLSNWEKNGERELD